MKKRLTTFFVILCLFSVAMFPYSAFAAATVTSIVPNRTESWSEYNGFYLNPGKYIYLDVQNKGSRTFYVKVVPQNNPNTTRPTYNNYFAGGYHSGKIKIGAPVGYYLVQIKCTTGKTVFTDCHGTALMTDFP